jgi:GT2 family glycosyltransferase
MIFADRPNVINSTGINLDAVGFAWDRRGGELDDRLETEPVEVFGPCAGAALYRRAMLDEIGLFDEDFFAYLEDVDLAWRARLAGWRCLYVPAARVYHIHSATAVEGSPFKNRLLGRNKVWLIAKNYPMPQLVFYLPLILLYDLAAVLFTLIVRRDVSSWEGRLDGLRGLRRIGGKRQAVQALRQAALDQGRLWRRHLSPLSWPWQVSLRYRHLKAPSRKH